MRRMLALIVMVVLAALPAAALQTPTPTHAASYRTLTGTIVATPRSDMERAGFTFLMQVGNNTILVRADGRTQFVDSMNAPIGVGAVHDGDRVSVTGYDDRNELRAVRVQDLALPRSVNVQLQGQIALPIPAYWQTGGPFCLANARINLYRRPLLLAPAFSQCRGALPVYFNGSTRFFDRWGGRVPFTILHRNDSVTVSAILVDGRITASVVRDTSAFVRMATLTGLLEAAPPAPAPTQLLLQVNNRTVLVQVNPQTQIVNNDNAPLSLSSLHAGDRLEVTGQYNDVEIGATRVRDLSQSTPITLQVSGQIANPLPAPGQISGPLCVANASVSTVQPQLHALIATPCGNNLAVYLTGSTTIVDHAGTALPLSAVMAGDTVTITGTTASGQFVASQIQDASQPQALQVTGQVANPLPPYGQTTGPLCVANAQVTGYQQPQVHALIATPCGNNLTLYLTSNTVIQNSAGQTIALYALRANDSLSFTATLINGQLTASLVQDHSL